MKESRFIDQNHKKWADFTAEAEKQKDPAKLSRLFIQITDDLSFARTFYPNRSITLYLNSIAESIFVSINRGRRLKLKEFVHFWKTSLPLLNYEARVEHLISFFIFVMAFVIGMLSVADDSTFATLMLGEDYIRMTKENIEKGDPVAVYKSIVPFEGFLFIALNNLLVAARTFVFGIFSSIGTIFILLFNGVMVGSFQQYFVNEGVFLESFLSIWQHGGIEILSVIFAGGAGITMGKGLFFPGTHTRLQSLFLSAKRGLKIFMGVVPAIAAAAIIEAYITRLTFLPDSFRFVSILFFVGLFIAYYVWYPYVIARKNKASEPDREKIEYVETPKMKFGRVYSEGQLFENTLVFIGVHFSRYFKPIIILSVLATGLIYFSIGEDFLEKTFMWGSPASESWMFLFDYNQHPFYFVLQSLVFVILMVVFTRPWLSMKNKNAGDKHSQGFMRLIFAGVVFGFMINLFYFINFFLAFLLTLAVFPLMLTIVNVFSMQKGNFFSAVFRGSKLYFGKYSIPLLLSFKIGLILIILSYLASGFLSEILYLFLFLFEIDFIQGSIVPELVSIFTFLMAIYLGLGTMVTAMVQMYFSLHEIETAEGLMKRIEDFGKAKKILGYERE